ncbi:MAG: N-6 DNA methylase, partial [Roseomonas sp.]|nr:N-6 DNA methylase [Roseomonas sp.]
LTGQNDPFLHFYETFLAAYNPAKRKARGVWYTPEPVVNFIVRAVDEVLQTEFGLPDGLADTSKVTIDWDSGQTDKKGKPIINRKEVHRVQILDPATGTGTFLAEVIKQIAPKVKGVAPGMWSRYIEADLIPRLHGFELLMASYAMCHMKLDMILTELGYKPTGNPPRLSVYLTNSLEEGEPVNQTLPFSQWLSREAKGANSIKRDTPIMCVIGNPPYSGHSSNKGKWISGLMEAYKQSPELKRPAQAKWLSDDYVKFIRLSEHLIDRNGEGVLGFITNHSYLDNPTFLDMREHLMRTFDRIYVMDLHGNAKKEEVAPDGLPDKNVFDIQQGVAIIIAIKKIPTSKAKKLAKVYHADLWGSRAAKYTALGTATIASAGFSDVTPLKSPWPFKPSNWNLHETYYGFPSIPHWFSPSGPPAPGIVTTHDQFAISWSEGEACAKVEQFLKTQTEQEARSIWKLCSQEQWNYNRAMKGLANGAWRELVKPISYRPFDIRYTVYDPNVAVHRRERASRHMLDENIALLTTKANRDSEFAHALVCSGLSEVIGLSPKTASNSMHIPLYLYPEEQDLEKNRRINLDRKLWDELKKRAAHPSHGTPDEVQVFDYIYGVLHCPAYRATYAEFLKIDFPRIPWPASPDEFWDVSAKGTQLRKLHLMDPATIGPTPYPFIGEGDNLVDKPDFRDGKVWINKTQYFDAAPKISWGFYIGGYQPAQKWLKDRKGRALSFDDVKHYQRILKILSETDRIMKTITMTLPTAA